MAAALFGWGSMGVFDGGSVAYLTTNRDLSELGVCAYGSDAPALADRVAARVREWHCEGGPTMELRSDVHKIVS